MRGGGGVVDAGDAGFFASDLDGDFQQTDVGLPFFDDGGFATLPPIIPDPIYLGTPTALDIPLGRTWDVESVLSFHLTSGDRDYGIRVLPSASPILHIESPATDRPMTISSTASLRIVARFAPDLETRGATLSIERDRGLAPLNLRISAEVTQNPLAPASLPITAATQNCREPECWPLVFIVENEVIQGVQLNFAELLGTDVRPIRSDGSRFIAVRQTAPVVTAGIVPAVDEPRWATLRLNLERPDHSAATSSIPVLYMAHHFAATGRTQTLMIDSAGLPSEVTSIVALPTEGLSRALQTSVYDAQLHQVRFDLNVQDDPGRSYLAAVLEGRGTRTLVVVFNVP